MNKSDTLKLRYKASNKATLYLRKKYRTEHAELYRAYLDNRGYTPSKNGGKKKVLTAEQRKANFRLRTQANNYAVCFLRDKYHNDYRKQYEKNLTEYGVVIKRRNRKRNQVDERELVKA